MFLMAAVQLLFWAFVIYLGVRRIRWIKNEQARAADNKAIDTPCDGLPEGKLILRGTSSVESENSSAHLLLRGDSFYS